MSSMTTTPKTLREQACKMFRTFFPLFKARPDAAFPGPPSSSSVSDPTTSSCTSPTKTQEMAIEEKTTASAPQSQQESDEGLYEELTTFRGKRVLCEPEGIVDGLTAHAWPSWKKWMILSVVAICQTSMNFNAAIYSNAIEGINKEFNTTKASLGMLCFLIPYAFGCELWAPWSEELGRHWVMQISLLCVNISIVICLTAQSLGQMFLGRVIGGLSSAGGSVTLGMVADMFLAEDQQYPVAWASLWSCLGAVVGGICGGPLQQYTNWRTIFWVQLGFGIFTQACQLIVSTETRAICLLDREAVRRRKATGEELYARSEVASFFKRISLSHMCKTFLRPYSMLLTEPIVLCLSLLSGFADALVFMFFESYGLVFAQWNFSPTSISLILLSLAGAYWATYFGYFPIFARHRRQRKRGIDLAPETRLTLLCFLVWTLPLGLLGAAFAGEASWQGMIFCTCLIGIANWAIYFATIDYMVEAYGSYSASATGGNGFCRDFLAGLCVLYTRPMFHELGIRNTFLVLFGMSFLLCVPVVIFYYNGPAVRWRSRFAQKILARRVRDQRVADLIVAQRARKVAEETKSETKSEATVVDATGGPLKVTASASTDATLVSPV